MMGVTILLCRLLRMWIYYTLYQGTKTSGYGIISNRCRTNAIPLVDPKIHIQARSFFAWPKANMLRRSSYVVLFKQAQSNLPPMR